MRTRATGPKRLKPYSFGRSCDTGEAVPSRKPALLTQTLKVRLFSVPSKREIPRASKTSSESCGQHVSQSGATNSLRSASVYQRISMRPLEPIRVPSKLPALLAEHKFAIGIQDSKAGHIFSRRLGVIHRLSPSLVTVGIVGVLRKYRLVANDVIGNALRPPQASPSASPPRPLPRYE